MAWFCHNCKFLLNKNSKFKVHTVKNIMNDRDRNGKLFSENAIRDNLQSMINDSIRQTSTTTNFGIQKSQKEELIRLVKNPDTTTEKFKQKFESIGVKSRFIPEFLDEFMQIALENGNFNIVIFLNKEYNIPLKKDTIDWCIKYKKSDILSFVISTGTVRLTKANLIQAAKEDSLDILNWFISNGWATIADHTVLEELINTKQSRSLSIIINSLLMITENIFEIISCAHKAVLDGVITPQSIQNFILKIPVLLENTKDPSDNELIYIAKMQYIPKDKMLEKFKVYDTFVANKSKINMFPLIKKYILNFIELKKILSKKFNQDIYLRILSFM